MHSALIFAYPDILKDKEIISFHLNEMHAELVEISCIARRLHQREKILGRRLIRG